MFLPLNARIFVSLLNACFDLATHCMILGLLSMGKCLLKPRFGTRYLMELDFRNEAWPISCLKP